jgi:prepilin peptidase CpaA
MLPGWLLRFTGGGDVKLLAVVGAFVGSPIVLYAFVFSIFVGATVAIIYSVYVWAVGRAASPWVRYGIMLTTLRVTGRPHYIRPDETEAVGRRFPLAPAIALGSIGAVLWMS